MRHLRILSDAWKALVFFVTVRAAAKPCRSRRVPPVVPEPSPTRAGARS
ncbi:hypothetical protein [Caulobacter segnis]|nr:hypothetical protein [Caulobacter segnis]MDR6624157.1 hypothetical protein [Caulobacter segnis]